MRRRSDQDEVRVANLALQGAQLGEVGPDGYAPLTLQTDRGEVEARLFPAESGEAAVIAVPGAGDGFESPMRGRLYPALGRELPEAGISVLWLSHRHPADLLECTLDAVAAATYLRVHQGVERLGLIGWSFGGAVVVQAASMLEEARAVVTVATQSYGIDPIATLGPRCGVLLLHGRRDTVLPTRCSEYGYQVAREPKRLMIHDAANHGLDEWADEAPQIVRDYFTERLTDESA